MGDKSDYTPLFVPAMNDLNSIALHLALQIKGVSPTNSKPKKTIPKPLSEVADNNLTPMMWAQGIWHVGLVAILDLLESAVEAPSMFPNGNKGMPIALRYWAEQFLQDCLTHDIGSGKGKKHLSLIARQMDDGRDFLQGVEPGLADIMSFSPLIILSQIDQQDDVLKVLSLLKLDGWFLRMKAFYDQSPLGISGQNIVLAISVNDDTGDTTDEEISIALSPDHSLSGHLISHKGVQVDLGLVDQNGELIRLRTTSLDFDIT